MTFTQTRRHAYVPQVKTIKFWLRANLNSRVINPRVERADEDADRLSPSTTSRHDSQNGAATGDSNVYLGPSPKRLEGAGDYFNPNCGYICGFQLFVGFFLWA